MDHAQSAECAQHAADDIQRAMQDVVRNIRRSRVRWCNPASLWIDPAAVRSVRLATNRLTSMYDSRASSWPSSCTASTRITQHHTAVHVIPRHPSKAVHDNVLQASDADDDLVGYEILLTPAARTSAARIHSLGSCRTGWGCR
jgi:Lon protease-like protein